MGRIRERGYDVIYASGMPWTGHLTAVGRLGVIALMCMGRLGPLTLLAAAASRSESGAVRYPEAEIAVG